MTRRSLRCLLLIALCALMPLTGRAQGPAQPVFHAIGDLPGGPTLSSIRDATRVGANIYAVGSSAANPQTLCTAPGVPAGCVGAYGSDTPVLWSYNATSGTASLTALPNIVNNTVAGNTIVANAITPNGDYIASAARINAANGQRAAVRVQRALVPFPAANLSLQNAPYNGGINSGAAAISNDGSVLWGNTGSTRAARWDLGNAAGNVTIPLLRPTDTNNQILAHDASGDGTIGAGVSFPGATYTGSTGGQAFRYKWNSATNTGTLSGVPFSPNGGTWNRALDVSNDGRYTLVSGDNLAYPNGEHMIHDATTGTLVELGSPSSAWRPSGFGGMTDDGAVVAASYFSAVGNAPGLAYIHNANGWFQVNGMLRRAGIDLRSQGWDVEQSLNITGISGDGTLLFGAMPHNGTFEGFVLEFPAGYLATYDIDPVPVSDTSIVGAWTDPSDPSHFALVFMKDGTYYHMAADVPPGQTNTNGFERGYYTWNSATGNIQIDTLVDTNGDDGIGDSNDRAGIIVTVNGDTLTAVVSPTDTTVLTRLPNDLESFADVWVAGDPTAADASRVFVLLADGTYLMAEDNDPNVNGFGGRDGVESGTWAIDGAGLFTATALIDTNGDWGFSNPIGQSHAFLDFDHLTAVGGDETGMMPIARVIDPNAVRPAITSALSVHGVVGQPLAYQVTGTFRPWMFGAAGLPAGLSIDGGTGLVTGTPSTPGTFGATITAANTLATGAGVIQFVIDPITCTAGSYRAADTDVACTPAPAGSYVPADGATAAIACPVGTYQPNTGSTACLIAPAGTYVGVEGAVAATPCPSGTTSEAGASACTPVAPTVARSGFFAPVKAGLNVVKGGSTVPLKFTVAIDGVAKTTTTGLALTATPVSCATGAATGAATALTSTGGTSLRYSDGQFILNWTAPSTAGACYVVRMTTAADGGSIAAAFQIK